MTLLTDYGCSNKNHIFIKPVQRKKPKQIYFKNNTWSSAPPQSLSSSFISTEMADDQQTSSTAAKEEHNFIVPSTPIGDRIEFYEQQYKICMESRTNLSSWIKMTKEKGLPTPLTEGYIPPTSRSRLPDFLFSSLSTRHTRKNQPNVYFHHDLPAPTPARSSLSTFLKKATDSLSTTYVPLKRQQQQKILSIPKSSPPPSPNNNRRFSLTSSLNLFSFPKRSYSNITEKYCHSSDSNKEEVTVTGSDETVRQRHSYRFSTPPPPFPNLHHYRSQEKKKQQYNISPPIMITTISSATTTTANNRKLKTQPSILPHSPSSIFLERLRSLTPCHEDDMIEEEEKLYQIIQPNISSKQSPFYTRGGSIDDGNMTPPSSPSSTDCICTPPLISNYSHKQYLSKRKQQQEMSFSSLLPSPPPSSNDLTSLSPIATTEKPGDTNKKSQQQQKRKRASLLSTAPSLSSIRLLSQKSQFLKRSSMLA